MIYIVLKNKMIIASVLLVGLVGALAIVNSGSDASLASHSPSSANYSLLSGTGDKVSAPVVQAGADGKASALKNEITGGKDVNPLPEAIVSSNGKKSCVPPPPPPPPPPPLVPMVVNSVVKNPTIVNNKNKPSKPQFNSIADELANIFKNGKAKLQSVGTVQGSKTEKSEGVDQNKKGELGISAEAIANAANVVKNKKKIASTNKIMYKRSAQDVIEVNDSNFEQIYKEIVLDIDKLSKSTDKKNVDRVKYLKTVESWMEKDFAGKLPNKLLILISTKKTTKPVVAHSININGNKGALDNNNPFLKNRLKPTKVTTSYIDEDGKPFVVTESNYKTFYDKIVQKVSDLQKNNNKDPNNNKFFKKLQNQIEWLQQDYPDLKKTFLPRKNF